MEVLDGRPLREGEIIRLRSDYTSGLIQFYVIHSPNHSLILGLHWLRTHNPHVSWREGQITQWDVTCQDRCLAKISRIHSIAPDSSVPVPDTVALPPEYTDLTEAFSKKKASQLPIHRSVDCTIDFLPGTTPPRGRIFPLSQPESKTMKRYIEEELAKRFIRPSTSPSSAGFFFVKKKDGGLRPCIDYRCRWLESESSKQSKSGQAENNQKRD